MPASPSALGMTVQGSAREFKSWELAEVEPGGVRKHGPGLSRFLILWGMIWPEVKVQGPGQWPLLPGSQGSAGLDSLM